MREWYRLIEHHGQAVWLMLVLFVLASLWLLRGLSRILDFNIDFDEETE